MNTGHLDLQWVTAIGALVTAIVSFVLVALGLLTNNKRIDDLRNDTNRRFDEVKDELKLIRLTLEAIRQDIADDRTANRVLAVEVANLKERMK